MKGILLAGGTGSRLDPLTRVLSKHLLPVYDVPMVFHPLSTLMLAGIQDVLVITRPEDQAQFITLLADGSQWGIALQYASQHRPEGVAQALVIGNRFIAGDRVALILGDNVFLGEGWPATLQRGVASAAGAVLFGAEVTDPQHYGVAELDDSGSVVSLAEKPVVSRSRCAVTGLYLYDAEAPVIARGLKPSARGEYEITDVNREYLKRRQVRLERIGGDTFWQDVGTHDALLETSLHVRRYEQMGGVKPGCVDEVAFRMGYIDADRLLNTANAAGATAYAAYLHAVAHGRVPHVATTSADWPAETRQPRGS